MNDRLGAEVIKKLASSGARFVASRCAGYNNLDLDAVRQHGLVVVRVPDLLATCGRGAHDQPHSRTRSQPAFSKLAKAVVPKIV